MRAWCLLVVVVGLAGVSMDGQEDVAAPYVVVLGIAQDAGIPQAGCRKDCCAGLQGGALAGELVVSLGIVDPASGERWLIEATPDLARQLAMLDGLAPDAESPGLDGIFITHAHIGHYTGLMHLGREVMGARGTPVHAMPRFGEFLRTNGPWDQLVKLGNIEIRPMRADKPVRLNDRLSVTPFLVPHRDEYSETVGFRIDGPEQSVVFIPDIDKWERWDRRIEDVIAQCDVAYLDGTFFDGGELPGRDMSEIPHPFISESIDRFESLPAGERAKVRFIHLNHTNRARLRESDAAKRVRDAGMRVAVMGERVGLGDG